MSKELRIESYNVINYNCNHEVELWIGGDTCLEFKIKYDATPQEFIKHLRSMIWAIEKKVIENEEN